MLTDVSEEATGSSNLQETFRFASYLFGLRFDLEDGVGRREVVVAKLRYNLWRV
jgi:hypothetical protein